MACRHSHSFMRCGTFMDEHVGAAHKVHDDLPAVQGRNDGKPGGGKGAMVSRVPAFRHDRRHEDMTFPDLHRTLPPLFLKRLPQCLPVLRRKSVIPSCSRMIFSRCSGNIISSRQRHRCLQHAHPYSPFFLTGQEPSSLQKNTKNTSLHTEPYTYSCFSHGGAFPQKHRGCVSPFKASFSCRASVPSHAREPAQEAHD